LTNRDVVLSFLRSISPQRVTNSTIVSRTGISPHQQVFAITSDLRRRGLISARIIGGEWEFWSDDRGARRESIPGLETRRDCGRSVTMQHDTSLFTPTSFELLARRIMSALYSTPLEPRRIPAMPKLFDMVSPDYSVVGDAKYFAMVQDERIPPAKFSVIAEHVWLLGRCQAARRFLVFGHDRRVPEEWLRRYGSLVQGVQFYFLAVDGNLSLLN
jgi:hypothetical protein